MEQKTRIQAEDGKSFITIIREFDLPVTLLFKAYTEPAIIEQWMGTRVLKLDNHSHGGWQFETSDKNGNIVFRANGVVHTFTPGKQIIRTFEMENTPFPVQLEFLGFEALTDDTSQLNMQIVYRSVEDRDNMLRLPFAQGINMAHNRLQDIVNKLK